MPKISVVIPTIRRPQIVRRAIQSVFNQSFSDFEIVVVIDGPDPDTYKSVSEIADARLTVLQLPQNVGLAEARNQGVLSSVGQWIAFLDDDDEWLPAKLEKQIAVAEKIGDHEALVITRYLEKANTFERIAPEILPISFERFSEYLYIKRGGLLPSTFLVSASLARRIPFSRGLRHVEDVDWLLRLAAESGAKIGVVPDVTAIWNNFATANRESQNVPWTAYYLWALSRRELFTPLAFSMCLVKCAVQAARDSRSPIRDRFHILLSALLLGSCRPKVFFYFFCSAFLGKDSKRKLRELISTRARRFVRSGDLAHGA